MYIAYIIDGYALFQAQVALLTTFGELAESIFDKLSKVEQVDFITDKYEALSNKATQRMRRSSKPQQWLSGQNPKRLGGFSVM